MRGSTPMKELTWIARVRARRVPSTSIYLFIVAAVVLGHTTGASPGWQEAGRYWQQAKYQSGMNRAEMTSSFLKGAVRVSR